MQFTKQPQTRGIRLIVDNQHVKTVSKKMLVFITNETIESISFDTKRITQSEKQYLLNIAAYNNWLKDLANNEKLVYELIKDSKPISRRNVYPPTGYRLEFIYENGLKVKVPDKIYYALPKLEETTAHLSY